jgi:hypothetical protein
MLHEPPNQFIASYIAELERQRYTRGTVGAYPPVPRSFQLSDET